MRRTSASAGGKALEDLAERLAGQAIRTGKEVVLEPMPPLERKVIHAKLQNHPQIKTLSKGEELIGVWLLR